MEKTPLEKSAQGSAYNLAANATTMVLGFIRSILLMRMLEPEYFGIVALSLFFTTLVSPFAVMGIDHVLIQNRDADEVSFSTHFILRMVLGSLLILFAVLFSPIMLSIYRNQEVVVYIFFILLMFNLLESSYATQNVIIRRELMFCPLAILKVVASLMMTIVAPLLAYLGAGIWSLVAEEVVGIVIRWIGFWLVLHPWKLSIKFDWVQAKFLLKTGSNYLSSNLLGILLDRFDDFWIGTSLSSKALGFYSRAYNLAQYPERIVATPIVEIFFPTYSAIQNNRTELSKAFFRSSCFLIRVGFLFAVLLMFIASELTIILFTATWLPIVPIFRLMLIYILLDPFYVNLSYLIAGIGKPGLLTRTRLVQTAIFIISVVGLAYLFGVEGVAVAANVMMLIGTMILIILIRQFVSFSFIRMLFWPTVALIISSTAGLLIVSFSDIHNIWANIVIKSSLITATYVLTLYFAERQIIHDYVSFVFRPLWKKMKSLYP